MFKATLRGEHTVAIKTMRVAKITKRELAKFKAELIIMAPLHHPASAAPSIRDISALILRDAQH